MASPRRLWELKPRETAPLDPLVPLPDAPLEDAASDDVAEKPMGAVCDACDAVAAEVADDNL